MKQCKKVVFSSKREALKRLRQIAERPDPSRQYSPTAAVSCNRCKGWHLTSQGGKSWGSGKRQRNSVARYRLSY